MNGNVTYVGHATTLVEIDGTRLLTDPVLRSRIGHLRRREAPPPAGSLRPDAVLISHAHHDHLDLPSLRKVARECALVAPEGLGAFLKRQGFERVTELAAGDRTSIGSLEITAVMASHDGRRRPLGARAPALGFVMEGSASVYFAGDTDLFEGMAELHDALDLALLPVWGWGRSLGPGHLDPERAAQAVEMIRPRNVVPIHWGTLAALGVPWEANLAAPAEEFARLCAKLAPDSRVWVLAPGSTMAFEDMVVER
jgi:L-ascorbate metabolism protein UlaG (beta-lactamase superfamily)